MDGRVKLMSYSDFHRAMDYAKKIAVIHDAEVDLLSEGSKWVIFVSPQLLYKVRYEEDDQTQMTEKSTEYLNHLDAIEEIEQEDKEFYEYLRASHQPYHENDELYREISEDRDDWSKSEEGGWYYD